MDFFSYFSFETCVLSDMNCLLYLFVSSVGYIKRLQLFLDIISTLFEMNDL